MGRSVLRAENRGGGGGIGVPVSKQEIRGVKEAIRRPRQLCRRHVALQRPLSLLCPWVTRQTLPRPLPGQVCFRSLVIDSLRLHF